MSSSLENSQAGSYSGSVTKRLQQELKSLMFSGPTGVSACPQGDNMFVWQAKIKGPADTVFDGLEYQLSIEFNSGYPVEAPTVKFVTPCFHPNVDQAGNICLDILKEKWSAVYDVKALLLSLQSLLGEPNNDSPLNGYAASLWADQTAYEKHLRDTHAANN
jgi:ubiquitin-conjugating enzyme E2 C